MGAEQLDEARVTVVCRVVQRGHAILGRMGHVDPMLGLQRDRRVAPLTAAQESAGMPCELAPVAHSARSLGFHPPASSAVAISAYFPLRPSSPSVVRPSGSVSGMAGPPAGRSEAPPNAKRSALRDERRFTLPLSDPVWLPIIYNNSLGTAAAACHYSG